MSFQAICHGPQNFRERIRFGSRRLRYRLTGINNRKLLFIACFPKSGSTYLMKLLSELTGFPRVHPTVGLGATEQEFCERSLKKIHFQDGVCHQHVKATQRNLKLARQYNLKPVVLVRNIYDVVPSLIDHFHDLSTEFPTGAVPREFFQWRREKQEVFVATFHLPWYFNFLSTWSCVPDDFETRWVTYEDLVANTADVVEQLCLFWRLDAHRDAIDISIEAVKHKNTRKNRGEKGRGKTLCAEAVDRINQMALLSPYGKSASKMIGTLVTEEVG